MARDRHWDVDFVMGWPVEKLYRYMAFYITESDEFKQKQAKRPMTENEIANKLGGWDE